MRVLIFGTSYADTGEALNGLMQWRILHSANNPNCDRLLVDSASPLADCFSFISKTLQLGDNIGHLARGGQDGWGRAFCRGLQYAVERGYDYVAHIEGDSLFRLKVMPICERMRFDRISAASVPVRGTKRPEKDWVETGMMIFDVNYLRDARIVEQYNWQDCEPKRRYPQTPEWHLHRILGAHLKMMPWRAERGDTGQITAENVGDFDWVTHVPPDVADAFVRENSP